jgi:outer membrane lipoprotein
MMRGNLRFFFLLFLPALVSLAGCAPRPFPQELLNKIDRTITFPELLKDPEKYKDAWVMFAGMIIVSRNTKDGTSIEVLQKPMNSDNSPLQTDETGGRFIVQSDAFLDTAVYHRGRLITVIAQVAGKKELQLDEIQYQYPLLVLKDLHLWTPSPGPRFFFGLGVSHRM